MSTDDRFTDEEKKSIALEMFLKETGHFDPQEPTPDPEALRNELLMAKSAFRGEGQLLGDDEEEAEKEGEKEEDAENFNYKRLLNMCFQDWKIAYDCPTDDETETEMQKVARYVNTLKNPYHGMDGFIGGSICFVSFHFILFLCCFGNAIKCNKCLVVAAARILWLILCCICLIHKY